MSVHNRGDVPAHFKVSTSAAWLSVTPAVGDLVAREGRTLFLTASAANLTAGEYCDTLRVERSDPLMPLWLIPVAFRVMEGPCEADPELLRVAVPWRAEQPETLYTTYRNFSCNTSYFAYSDVGWLAISPTQLEMYPGEQLEVRFITDTYSLDPGPHTATVQVGDVIVPFHLEVLETPPSLAVVPGALEIDRVEGSSPVNVSLLALNAGFEVAEVTLSDDSPWLRSPGGGRTVPGGGESSLALRVDPAGLAPGVYTAGVRIRSNDPLRPELSVPVTLRVSARVQDIPPMEIRLDETAFRCSDGDAGVQFLELAPEGAGTTFRSTLGLRVEDRSGATLIDRTGIFPGRGDGEAWPAGSRWLLGSVDFGDAAGFEPDFVLDSPLDPAGGTITLYDTAPGFRILERFSYGTRGGVGPPGPGMSLRWIGDGFAVSETPDPTRFDGTTISGLQCDCPAAEFRLEYMTSYSTAPADHRFFSPGRTREAEAAYDFVSGTFSVRGTGAEGRLSLEETFIIEGVPPGIPVPFRARLFVDCSASGQQNEFGIPHSGSFSAEIRDDDGHRSAIARSSGTSHRAIARGLDLDITRSGLEPFRLFMTGYGGGTYHAVAGGSGRVLGTLEFLGLPAGARVRSCRGFLAESSTIDNTPPDLAVTASPGTLQPPNHQMEPVTIDVSVADDLDPEPLVRLVSIVSSDPDAGESHGDRPGDISGADAGTDDREFLLRAERSGRDPSRTYTITYEAEDASGNVASSSTAVTVPHDGRSLSGNASRTVSTTRDPDSGVLQFEFEIDNPAPGVLMIFDLAGRRVAEIPFEPLAPGPFRLTWSGASPGGARVPSGLYFARLRLGPGVGESRFFKVTLVK